MYIAEHHIDLREAQQAPGGPHCAGKVAAVSPLTQALNQRVGGFKTVSYQEHVFVGGFHFSAPELPNFVGGCSDAKRRWWKK
jgi:hypothetical protein